MRSRAGLGTTQPALPRTAVGRRVGQVVVRGTTGTRHGTGLSPVARPSVVTTSARGWTGLSLRYQVWPRTTPMPSRPRSLQSPVTGVSPGRPKDGEVAHPR